MEMREEDLRQRKAHPVAHHLALGALTTLEQQRLAFAHEGHGGDVALDSWSRCRGSREGHGSLAGDIGRPLAGKGGQKPEGTVAPVAALCRLVAPLKNFTLK